jgi:23S rRNA (adenine2030-N6)-methyltransferase
MSRTPPTPRRGLMLIDPSWEVKTEYDLAPKRLSDLHKRWNVGVLMLWYPILADARHLEMKREIAQLIPQALIHEVGFAPARPGHGLVGSGLVVVNPPYGFTEEAARIAGVFAGRGAR